MRSDPTGVPQDEATAVLVGRRRHIGYPTAADVLAPHVSWATSTATGTVYDGLHRAGIIREGPCRVALPPARPVSQRCSPATRGTRAQQPSSCSPQSGPAARRPEYSLNGDKSDHTTASRRRVQELLTTPDDYKGGIDGSWAPTERRRPRPSRPQSSGCLVSRVTRRPRPHATGRRHSGDKAQSGAYRRNGFGSGHSRTAWRRLQHRLWPCRCGTITGNGEAGPRTSA